jgi:hypothetical protein
MSQAFYFRKRFAMDRKILAIAAMFFALGALLGARSIQEADASPLQGAGAPTVVSYQGVISDGGVAYDGTGYFKFAIVNAAGDTTYWSNDGTSTGGGEPGTYVTLTVNDGYFMVLLGDTNLTNMTALPASVFSDTERYLRIWFSSGSIVMTQLSPDQRFTATPYALQAQEAVTAASADDADTLDGVDSSELYTKTEVDALLAAYESRISALETKLASVSVENGGDDVVFTDVNVHVRSGSGATEGTVNGRGNLIVGYNEDSGSDVRTGSHNIIIGRFNSYSRYGGFIAGTDNTISGPYAVVSGGSNNEASGSSSSVSGGKYNIASGDYSSVLGGGGFSYMGNEAWALYSVVVGGRENTAGDDSTTDRSVGWASVVLGGFNNSTTDDYASVSGGSSNTASGEYASVSGGVNNEAGGQDSTIGGGANGTVTGGADWRAGTLWEDN